MMFFARCISLLLLVSCQSGIKWNPDFYIGDHLNQSIVNENNQVIYTDQPEFDGYACLSEQKVKELSEILTKARMPKATKKIILDNLPRIPIR